MNRMATRKEAAALRKRSTPAAAARNGAHASANGAAAGARSAPAAPTPGSAIEPGRGKQQTGESLEQCVFRSLDQYFADLNGAKPHALHEMVLGAIERPLLQFALQRCEGNQSAAADLLGINRNTLRRKLQDYGLH